MEDRLKKNAKLRNGENSPTYGSIQGSDPNLNKSSQNIATYWYRWYIVGLFGLLGLTQGAIWNTWSPISTSALCAYNFTSDQIALLTNWGPISFIVFMPLYAWLLNNKGLKLSIVSTILLVAVGSGIRCIPAPEHIYKPLVHIGQFLNGIAGCVVMAAPPLLSNTWFPTEERVTATSIATLLNYMGTGVSYLVGPAIVEEPTKNLTNETSCNISKEEKNEITHDIMTLMYIEFAVSAFILICCLIFYPDKPPLPPSRSASVDRLDFKAGILALRKKPAFLLSSFVISLVLGVYSGFTGVLDVILSPLGVSQVTAGSVGFVSSMSGCVVGLFVGWFADRWKGHTKRILVVLYAIAFLSMLYFTFITSGWFKVKAFQYSDVGMWVTVVTLGVTLNASPSLSSEIVAESAYPTGEGVSTGILVWLLNVFSFVLLTILSVSSDNSYAIYLQMGSIAVALVLLIFFIQEPNSRLHLDEEPSQDGDKDDETAPLIPNTECVIYTFCD